MNRGKLGTFALLLLGLALALAVTISAQEPAAQEPVAEEPQPAAEQPGEESTEEAEQAAEESTEEAAEEEPAAEEAPAAEAPAAEAPAAAPPARQRQPVIRVQQGQIQIQIGGNFAGLQGDEEADATIVRPERELRQKLSRAQRLLEEERYSEAVRDLGSILQGQEDGALPAEAGEPIRFLKREARRLLGSLKPGREAYELQYGASARQLLDDALAQGNIDGVEAVARQFFHTQAGYEAAYLLGLYYHDQGSPLAAALTLRELADSPGGADYEPALSFQVAACWLWAGMAEKSQQALLDLRRRFPEAKLNLGGKQLPLAFGEADAVAWLQAAVGLPENRQAEAEVWAMHRGGPARNAPSVGGRPLLNYRWRVRMANDPYIMDHVRKVYEADRQESVSLLPSMHPLAVGDVVLVRTAQNLLAVDFRSGKQIWEVPVDDSLEQLLDVSGGPESQAAEQVNRALGKRLWQDGLYGTLSSDGEYVYSIEDLGFTQPSIDSRFAGIFGRRQRRLPTGARPYNRLAAHELRTEGKLKWALGGPPGEGALPLAGEYFLGPPLPLGGRLYVLAESNHRIRLLAIDPERDPHRGEQLVEWTQDLTDIQLEVLDNEMRRLAGATPSYADGVLVCPTGGGAAVAVELATRSLLWGYQYPRSPLASQNVAQIQIMRMNGMDVDPQEGEQWIDSSATISDGRVLLTPVESDELHCLDLSAGNLLWTRPREDGLYLGCVDRGVAVVVGRKSVRGLKLADGEPAWVEPLVLSSGAAPSGRGFFHQGRYYLPLSTAEVAAIDVATGRVVDSSRSRQGIVPGNLICYSGAVLSQGADYVDCFWQAAELERRVAETLREQPHDPEALTLRGEILLDQGRTVEAADMLRRSVELRDDLRTKELLFDTLLEGLRSDFAQQRGSAAEIERLVVQPQQWDAYLRLMAIGLQSQGENLAAFQTYLRLTELSTADAELGRVEQGLQVRRDRWVQAQLAELRAGAGPDDAAEMDRAIAARYEAAVAADGPQLLRRFLAYFGNQPQAEGARDELSRRLSVEDASLEIERLLRQVAASADARRAGGAVARLARLLEQCGQAEDAAYYYRQLSERFADVVCLDGQTGRALVEGLPRQSAAHPERAVAAWPIGAVDVERQTRTNPATRFTEVDVRDNTDPLAVDATVEIDIAKQSIVGRDGYGNRRWQASAPEILQQINFAFGTPGVNRARIQGHLAIVAVGLQVLAIDTLNTTNGAARVLWRQDLGGNVSAGQLGVQQTRVGVAWGGLGRLTTIDGSGRALGAIGPVTDDYLCLQRGRTVTALDPWTGELLWSRVGVEPNSQLFGDEEVVVVAAADGEEALVLRALDGEELGRRRIAGVQERMATLGRYVLAWRLANGEARVSLDDPWLERELWSHAFDPQSKGALLGLEAVGVVDGDQFTLLDTATGRPLVDRPIEPLADLSEIYLLRGPERYLLIANRPFQGGREIAGLQPIPDGDRQIIHGHVYGFDRRTGERVWMTPVENQGLMFAQPAGLPALVFGCHVYRRAGNNGFDTVTSLLCVDKRTGAIVYKEEWPQHVASLEIAARPEASAVDLKLPRNTIVLTFTDRPPPEEVPVRDDLAPVDNTTEDATETEVEEEMEEGEDDGVIGEPADDLPQREADDE